MGIWLENGAWLANWMLFYTHLYTPVTEANFRFWDRLCNNSNLWIFVFNFDLKTFSTMNIGGDSRLILYFIGTATHCQRRKISFFY
jgi:hypothetical protein